jgi:adenylosuccinate synthase
MIVQGLQYGSEAKGAIAAGIARTWKPDTVATAWGPNAGHTVRDGDFRFVSTMLATAALYPSVQTILIGPGSVVDIKKLAQEIEAARGRLHGKWLVMHPQAAYLKPEHAEQERDLLRIGSTMKGTMQAAMAKMHRKESAIIRHASPSARGDLLLAAHEAGMTLTVSEALYDTAINSSEKLLIEGAQGYSLSIHGMFYPYCTSRDVSPAQVLADCRVPIPTPPAKLAVIGVLRTYPIRVANRKSEDGQEYTSGGFYGDQHELDWAKDLGREPELTTVTKLPRRIFSFSHEQIKKAIRQVRPTALSLTFCDYLEPRPTGTQMGPEVMKLVRALRDTVNDAHMGLPVPLDTVSYGPDMSDIFNVLDPAGNLDHNPFDYDNKDYNEFLK